MTVAVKPNDIQEPAAVLQQKASEKAQAFQNLKKFTWDEVSKHNKANDCWLVVKGKVYDVTSWVPKHPGGRLIVHGGGRDSTAMFMSYHPSRVQNMLDKYLIGEVENYNSYYDWDKSQFYPTLQRRVESYMKEHNLNRDSYFMFFKTFVILFCWALSYYYTVIKGNLWCAVFLGFFHSQFGISIGHDACHGSYSKIPVVNSIARWIMDFMGGSKLVWWMQHNIGHHPHSNKQGDQAIDEWEYDPDVRSGSPIMRFNPEQNWRPHHRFQHIYIWFLFSFVGLRWYFNDIKAISRGKYHSIQFFEITSFDFWNTAVTKFLFAVYSFGIPLYLHGFTQSFLILAIYYSIASYCFCLVFATNHLTDTAEFPNNQTLDRDWASLQVMTASNYGADSVLWTTLSGALNYQIEHHLFPGICHVYLPQIAPIVKKTCEEFNVPYQSYPNYFDAIRGYYQHLKEMGTPPTATTTPNNKKQQ